MKKKYDDYFYIVENGLLKVNSRRFKTREKFKLFKDGKSKKRIAILLAVLLLGITSFTTHSVVRANENIIKIVDTQELDKIGTEISDHAPLTIMSSKNSENSSEVGTIPDGAIVQMDRKDYKQPKDGDETWSYVKYDGVSGYVNSKYLKDTISMYIDTSSYLDDYAPVRLKNKPDQSADVITIVPHGMPVYVSADAESIHLSSSAGEALWIEVTLPSGEVGYVLSNNLTSKMPAAAPSHYYGNITNKSYVFSKHN